MNNSFVHLLVVIAMNILLTLPDGPKTDFHKKTSDMLTNEIEPGDQSADTWTERIGVQIFQPLKTTPGQFKIELDKARARICPGGASQSLIEATENGYPTLVWYEKCPLNRTTGRPEFTWFKGIQRNDRFYLVQITLKIEEPSAYGVDYINKVRIGDTRLSDGACPPEGVSR